MSLPLLIASFSAAHAHPGHGATDGHGLLHYLADHGLALGLVAAGVVTALLVTRRVRARGLARPADRA